MPEDPAALRAILRAALAEINPVPDAHRNDRQFKAITPEEAEAAAERLYAMAPNARITSVLADVHGWTGFANAFTHQHTGMAADDPRVVLTGVLADATNLGLTRMAEACSGEFLPPVAFAALLDRWRTQTPPHFFSTIFACEMLKGEEGR